MVAAIYDDPREVDRRLRMYFWSDRAQWIEVIKAAVAARGGCTDDYPKSSRGYYAWSGAIARLRQIFRREGWIKSDDFGVETIFHPDLRVKITYMSTDDGTCDKSRSPRNRTVKGPAAEMLTDLNSQYEMFPNDDFGSKTDGFPIWYLCVFDNGKTVRAELSRPIEFKNNYFAKFSERIFLISGDDWSEIATISAEPDAAQDFDINVRRL